MTQPWNPTAPVASSGSGVVTLVEGSAFCISQPNGDIEPEHAQGLFFRDTRFLSRLRLRLNGRLPEPLAATATDPFSGAFVLRDHPRPGFADSHLVLFRHRYVGRGMREDLVLENHGPEDTVCTLELEVESDFADLFEVKEGRVQKVGVSDLAAHGSRLTFAYRRGAFRRAAHLDFSVEPRFSDHLVTFEVVVPSRARWELCVQLTPEIDGTEIVPRYQCGHPVVSSMPLERLESWRRQLPVVTTAHAGFQTLLERSSEDLAALRIFDPEHPDRVVVAAGAPWFMTLFGRDSLITSWMAMLADPDLALGTLQTLARFQGTGVDPVTEEEPGRILHEMRFGETAELSLGGGRVYYGSVDATPLFVMLLGELQRWGNRRADVDALLPAADRALEWVERHGDRDGDGYVEYQRSTDRGLRNQGWKDSWDAVRFADGRIASTPIALAEVQGYVYAAYTARGHFAVEHGDDRRAEECFARAAELKRRFNRDFWLEDRACFAMALDRDKRPVDALSSNQGHCLWTGIVDEELAPLVAKSIVGDELFSGWGVRTMGSDAGGFNPVSYHCGSVWPHDSALVAAGLVRYGFVEEAHRVIEGLVAAAEHFGGRLPELFSGFRRDEVGFPVSYPTSCSPQAWAAASPLLFLRTMLRFEPDIRNAELHLAPAVPDWVGTLRLERVPIMGGHLSIEVRGQTLVVDEIPDGLTIVRSPRRPTH